MNPPESSDALLLESARAWLRHRENCRKSINTADGLSPRTLYRYGKIVARLLQAANEAELSPGDLMAQYPTLVRWHYHAAAFRWHCASILLASIKAIDEHSRSGMPIDDSANQADLLIVAEVMRQLGKLRCPTAAHGKPRRKMAGKEALLPDGWRKRLIDLVPQEYRAAVLMLAAAGCRPAELACGVRCKVVEVGLKTSRVLKIAVEIKGAKSGSGFGHLVRTLMLDGTDEMSHLLITAIFPGHDIELGASVLVSMDARSIQKCLQRLARDHRPEGFLRVTPYSFRYAFRRDCERRSMSRGEIALAMGHQTRGSSLFYGKPRRIRPALASIAFKGRTQTRSLEFAQSVSVRSQESGLRREFELEFEIDRRRRRERQLDIDFS